MIGVYKHFVTDTGIKVPTITAEQMRGVDRVATEETGPILYQMMENAGRNLASMAIEILGQQWQRAAIVVLAGSGGNGGGGICAARHLANRNLNVTLSLTAPHRLQQVNALQYQIFQCTSGQRVDIDDLDTLPRPDLILDAVLGYGLQSAPHGKALKLIQWANSTTAPILSLDLPSGVNATTGETPGEFIHAQWTMTLALPKTGLLPEKTGHLVLADIGIPESTYRRLGLSYTSPFDDRFRVPLMESHLLTKRVA